MIYVLFVLFVKDRKLCCLFYIERSLTITYYILHNQDVVKVKTQYYCTQFIYIT